MTTPHAPHPGWIHPLITRVDPSLNRRRLLTLGATGLAAALTARSASAQGATPEATPEGTPEGTPVIPGVASLGEGLTGDPEAVEILRNAARVMAELSTFAFEIETTRGESTIFQGLNVREITGAVRRPVDFTATVSVDLPFGAIEVTAVGVDGQAWLQDPLGNGEDWIQLEGSENIVALINPDTLIVNSIGLVQDAQVDGTENLDGVETTRIAGTIDFAATAERVTGGTVELPEQISTEPLPVLIWVDDQGRVREIEVSGPIVNTETEDVVRVIRFFDFNEPVEIEVPPVP